MRSPAWRRRCASSGPETLETKIFGRLSRLAELDLHARELDRRARRAHAVRPARAAAVPVEEDLAMTDRDHRREDPEQRRPRRAIARLQRALEAWQPQFIDWWKDDGPGRLAGARHLPAHRDLGRDRRLGALRLREDAGLSLGHLPRAEAGRPRARLRRQRRPAGVGRGAGRVPQHAAPARRHAGRHRAGERRAAARPRRDRAVALRPAQPVPGQRRGGPSPVGDGLPAPHVLRPRRPRGGRGAARSAARGDADKPRILGAFNEPTCALAVVLHVHDVHRPRRQVSARARSPRAASIRSRARAGSC